MAAQTTDKLVIKSYNSTGCNEQKLSYLNEQAKSADILLVQEHWLFDSNSSKLSNGIKDYTGKVVSGMDENEKVIQGRPFGGCAIMWRKSIAALVNPIMMDSISKRVCSVTLTVGAMVVLLMSVYFPTDPGTVAFNDTFLTTVLADLQSVIEHVRPNAVIIGGDTNCDFGRHTGFANRISAFMNDQNIVSAWSKFTVDYTYMHNDGIHTSTIDHFLLSKHIMDKCQEGGVIHSIDNMSNHSVVYIDVNVGQFEHMTADKQKHIPKLAWYKACDQDIEQYKHNLDTLLENNKCSDVLVQCNDVLCQSTKHRELIDTNLETLMNMLCNSSAHIPNTCPANKSKIISGWNDYVKPFRDEAKFWKKLYEDLGKPNDSIVADQMRLSKREYHYAVRRVKSNKNLIKRCNFLNALLQGDRNFFDEVRRIKGTSKNSASVIDGLTCESEIASLFAEKYEGLFNSQNYDEQTLKGLVTKVHDMIRDNTLNKSDVVVTPDCVKKAIKQLKHNKSDGCYDKMASDHYIYAPDSLYKYLSDLYSSILLHGYMPDSALLATIIPIPKDPSTSHKSDKYRGIALSAIFTKILEYIILDAHKISLTPSDTQFAYKKKSSTTQCSWTVREVVSYFNRKGSDVYACLLDCSKAFDNIKHDILLSKLIEKGVSPIVVRLLTHMYNESKVRVKWNTKMSEYFDVANGVKQGSVLSPTLFSLYVDELGEIMEKGVDGCWVQGEYFGILIYADDIILLSPSICGLQRMLNNCEAFADVSGLTFNPTKTKCIKFHNGNEKCDNVQYDIFLGNQKLTWETQVPHLGHTLSCCNDFSIDVNKRKGGLIGCVNNITSEFGFAHYKCKLKLMQIYGTSFYGSNLWDLYGKDIDALYTTWNIGIRKLMSLPTTTHRRFLDYLSGLCHVRHTLKVRFMRYIHTLSNINNIKIKTLLHNCMTDAESPTCHIVRRIIKEYGLTMNCFHMTSNQLSHTMTNIYKVKTSIDAERWKCDMINELLECKYDNADCGLSMAEINDLIQHLASE